MDEIFQHFIGLGLSPDQARANADAAANALPMPYDIPNYTAPGQVDTFGDTAVEMMREPWSQAKDDWSRVQYGSGFEGLGAAGSAGINALTALGGGGAGLLSEIVPDIGGRGADGNELSFARDFLGFGDAFAGGGIGRGVNMLDDLIDAAVDSAQYTGRSAADVARRIEVDPNALGSMGGNVRLRPAGEVKPSVAEMRRQANIQRFGYDPSEVVERTPTDNAGFEAYLERVNPNMKRIAEGDRPNLMMGDMYGMMPRGSEAVGSKGNVTFHRSPDGGYYATALNPDVNGEDVIGYIMDRGDGTELAVVGEMQGKGVGGELQYLFRSENPDAPTGGLTEAGEGALRRTYERLADEGIVDGAVGLDVSRSDASSIFGEGSERVRYTDPSSGGTMEVVAKPDGSASVLELEVPEGFRGRGIGQKLQQQVLEDFPMMGGQVSSKAAATTAYRLGRRPPSKPNATLEEVFADIDEMSSVNMVSPEMQSRLGGASAPAPQGILAYHGSPHDFDEFSMDAIGTGEGAQAYGHGLYFAENEAVADSYKQSIRRNSDELKRIAEREGGLSGDAAEMLSYQFSMDDFHGKGFDEWLEGLQKSLNDGMLPLRSKEAAEQIINRSVEASDAVRVMKNPGSMYEVNINANPDDFLDWDAPLNEQPEKVRRAFSRVQAGDDPLLRELLDGTPEAFQTAGLLLGSRGSQAYNTLSSSASRLAKRPDQLVSQELRDAGIPGIKYKDGMSRGAEGGTQNFVVFDDKLISIVKKYGIAGAAAILGASVMDVEQAMAQGSQPQQQPQPRGLLSDM